MSVNDATEGSAGDAAKRESPAEEADAPRISIDQFAAIELKTGRVVAAEAHPNADKLLVMHVDTGEAEPRQIVAGIRAWWDPEQLVGKTLVICTNLAPAKLRGIESQGMMLAVKGDERVWPLTIEGEAAPGTRVT